MRSGASVNDHEISRRRLTYRGVVQGVGFRPTVYRCAVSLGLSGFVRNERSFVVVEVQGTGGPVAAFRGALRAALPPAARVDDVSEEEIPPVAATSAFAIAESVRTAYTLPPIPPDLAVCPDCVRELLDPEDRRYLYPFITCTQCGPRYSITLDTPFDRATTTMARFAQCPECLREFTDPADRRFHAQTNACPRCGPRLALREASGRAVAGDPLREAIAAIEGGMVVAVLGIGGFHLAADPSRGRGVERLRRDKERERKPFALMVRDLDAARSLCVLERAHEELLVSPASPIVIAPTRAEAPGYLSAVSDTGTLGIMLPYTPLHLLLFRHPGATIPYDCLVMTSGNLRGEPIVCDPDQGMRELSELADLFLVHDRAIAFRTDDSVARVSRDAGSSVCLLRRSRGFVPGLIRLAKAVPEPTLAVGGDLKSAPGLAVGADLHVAPYIGDLDNLAALDAFAAHIEGLLSLYRIRPSRIVHDLHPDYRSVRWALELREGTKVGVQHHHAHVLSVMAEHGLEEALGLAFDGTGYGEDGTIWGGEFLHATRAGYRRLGSFSRFALPGGDAAVLHPARTAFALLRSRFPEEAALLGLPEEERRIVDGMIDRGVSSPLTSSLGRIFDAAAAALGVVDRVTYEGEGPIGLEGLASRGSGPAAPRSELEELVPLAQGQAGFTLDASPLVARLLRRPRRGDEERVELALLFHRAIAAAAVRGALEMRAQTGLSVIAASGGVFQNILLRELVLPELLREGFAVYTNRALPPGDGGLCAGQAWFLGGFSGPV